MSKQKSKEENKEKVIINKIELTKGELRTIISSNVYQKMRKDVELTKKCRVKLMRLSMRLDPVVNIMEIERMKLADIYCEKGKDGQPKMILQEKLVKAYTKKDEKTGKETTNIPDNLPKEFYEFSLIGKNRNEFDKELSKIFEEDAEIPGDKISLEAEEIPDYANSDDLILLSSVINFKE